MSDFAPGALVAFAALIVLLLALGMALYQALHGRRAKLNRRIASVLGEGPGQGHGPGLGLGRAGHAAAPASGHRRRAVQAKLKAIEDSRNQKRGYRLREKLAQAGTSVTPRQYLYFAVAIGAAAAAGIALTSLPLIVVPLVAITFGLGLPKLILSFLVKKRLAAFTAVFPDAIDVIVRGIRSGLPVGECIAIIAREIPDPVGAEFRQITESQKVGLPLPEALARSVDRVPTSELRFFTIVLAIQQQTGGNLADTLAKLSDVLRSRKRMRDKIQAFSSEAKASAMIIGSLPLLVGGALAAVAPDYIALLFTTNAGHLMLFLSAMIMGMGVLVMRKMIHFDM